MAFQNSVYGILFLTVVIMWLEIALYKYFIRANVKLLLQIVNLEFMNDIS